MPLHLTNFQSLFIIETLYITLHTKIIFLRHLIEMLHFLIEIYSSVYILRQPSSAYYIFGHHIKHTHKETIRHWSDSHSCF